VATLDGTIVERSCIAGSEPTGMAGTTSDMGGVMSTSSRLPQLTRAQDRSHTGSYAETILEDMEFYLSLLVIPY